MTEKTTNPREGKMSGNWNDVLVKIRGELSGLAKFIDSTRRGIDDLEQTVKVGSEKFPEASSQLNAVTGELENAANNIMNILETLMADQEKSGALIKSLAEAAGGNAKVVAIARELETVNAKSRADMMDVFTNMSFQDLTGQKLKKVIGSLGAVQKRVLEMAHSFGLDETTVIPHRADAAKQDTAIKQDVVDMLIKELGTKA